MSFSSDHILQAAFIDDEDIFAKIDLGLCAGLAVHVGDVVVDLAVGDVDDVEEEGGEEIS